MTLLAPLILLGQMSTADLQALRQYRYGLSAARVEAMGLRPFLRFYESKTPNRDAGYVRGVGPAVFTDAYRENTARRYRTPLPPNVQAHLLALDKQIRFIGVLFARNAWLFTGGNAVDPESDDLSYAQAERRLYTGLSQEPEPERMRRRLAEYKAETLRNARKGKLYGAGRDQASGREALNSNLGKIDRAIVKATALCRTKGERAILFNFVIERTKGGL